MTPSRPIRLALLVAILKAVFGLVAAAFVLRSQQIQDPREVLLPTQALVFFFAGVWLILGGRNDRRALYLGGFFIALSGTLVRSPLREGSTLFAAPWGGVVGAIDALPVEALYPLFLWLFVRGFPDIPLSFRARRLIRHAVWTCIAAAVAVSLLSVPVFLSRLGMIPADSIAQLAHQILTRCRDEVLLALTLSAIIFMAWKAYHSRGEERRRGKLFFSSFLCAVPFMVDLLFEPLYSGMLGSATRTTRFWLQNAFVMSLPVVISYSVLVHHALDVKLIARKALQHALARSSASFVAAAPFLVLCAYLFQHRNETLVELLQGRSLLLLLTALLLGVLSLSYRQRILESIDRRFFREQYNARLILTRLADQIRGVRDSSELANLVCRGIDRALHLESVSLLVEDPNLGQLVDPKGQIQALDPEAKLATLVLGNPEPIDIDWGDSSLLADLPEAERHWLVDGRVRMLTPAFASDGSLIGLLVLGAKKSELPFLREDRQVLAAIGASSGLAIELLGLKRPDSEINIPEEYARNAKECLACGSVFPPDEEACRPGHPELREALVPYVLRRQFRFTQRIGAGGMAIVYRAADVKLGRIVAIKTLPRVSPEAAMRLHREARTAATVVHPGLAAIYGIETWQGTPMLILEYLESGTLADRLMDGPLPAAEVIRTGQSVAMALEKIHSVGILHRDIKPSNIGYTQDGIAKLLDFGIARIRSDLRQERPTRGVTNPAEQETAQWMSTETHQNTSEPIAGTLCYLSPEALDRARPAPSFDVWSLSVVLYEALSGENLFYGRDLSKILDNIRHARVPDIRDAAPECPAALADFFRLALHVNPGERPQSGRDLHQRLEEVRRSLPL